MKDFPYIKELALFIQTGISYTTYKKLIDYFENIENIFKGTPEEFKRCGCRNIYKKLSNSYKQTEEILKKAHEQGVKIVFFEDPEYPTSLKEIYSPPLFLFIKGRLLHEKKGIAIVGTRHPSLYGKNQAFKFAKQLCEAGFYIISGLARGIDTQAHLGALQIGETIAVVASDLANIYPPENVELANKIVKNGGAIISEIPFGRKIHKYFFPLRNRIISGLSDGVIIVEAPAKSGALITATWALEQGKNLFVVPGRVDTPSAYGSNNLIQQGAKLIQKVSDILEEYPEFSYISSNTHHTPTLTKEQKLILRYINENPVSIEEIMNKIDIEIGRIYGELIYLVNLGIVRQLPGKRFVRI